jgi:hypothetical protein
VESAVCQNTHNINAAIIWKKRGITCWYGKLSEFGSPLFELHQEMLETFIRFRVKVNYKSYFLNCVFGWFFFTL